MLQDQEIALQALAAGGDVAFLERAGVWHVLMRWDMFYLLATASLGATIASGLQALRPCIDPHTTLLQREALAELVRTRPDLHLESHQRELLAPIELFTQGATLALMMPCETLLQMVGVTPGMVHELLVPGEPNPGDMLLACIEQRIDWLLDCSEQGLVSGRVELGMSAGHDKPS